MQQLPATATWSQPVACRQLSVQAFVQTAQNPDTLVMSFTRTTYW